MQNPDNNLTLAWQYYELGRSYNNSLVPNQYDLVNTNIEFFAGNQWLHIPESPAMRRLPKPQFNIIKRIASLFVASLTSSAVTINFEPLSYYDGENLQDPDSNAAEYATAEVRNLFEKFKMEYRLREALFDGAQTGDYCAHFFWNPDALPYGGAFGPYRGEIEMELVDGINVMFGNPNTPDVESQPYVLVIGRDTVANLKREAERFRKNKARLGKGGQSDDAATVGGGIQPDSDWQDQSGVGGRTELTWSDDNNGKALYVYMYTKVTKEEKVTDPKTGAPMQENVLDADGDPIPQKTDDGRPVLDAEGKPVYKTRTMTHLVTTVHVTKATKGSNIFEDVDTGLTHYPIAWGNWEKQKNQYHGRALVTGIIPNQIFINTMFALVMRHLQLQSFPKTIFNADCINDFDNEIGRAVAARNIQPGQDLKGVAMNLSPADMSNQIMAVIDKAMAYTKDCLGATDAQMGNVKPDNTSALMVLQSSAEVPLENTRAGGHEWVEDIGAILLDMMGTYYGERPIVRERDFEEPMTGSDGRPIIDPTTGMMATTKVSRRVIEMFDFRQFKNLWLNVAVDVGATTYYSEIAMVQTMDNLRRDGMLTAIQYLERVPDKLIPRKQELIDDLRQQMASMPAPTSDSATVPPGAGNPTGAQSQSLRTLKNGAHGPSAMGGPISPAKTVANLPAGIQAKMQALPNEAQRALNTRAGLLAK